MKQNIIRFLASSLVFLFVFCHQVKSQYTKDFFTQLSKEYENYNLVQLKRDYHYKIDLVKGAPQIFLDITESFIIFKQIFGTPFERSLFSSTFMELTEFEANAYIFNGEKYKKKAIKTFTEKMNVDNDVFYDDLKEYSFLFPGTTNGSIVELKSRYKIKDPRMLNSVYMKSIMPIREFQLSIEFNKEIELDVLEFNMENVQEFSEKKIDKKLGWYQLKVKNLEALIREKHEADISYFVPHLLPIIRTYTVNGNRLNVLSDSQALYSWYSTFLKDIYTNVDLETLKTLSDSITLNCRSEAEEVDALFQWVQQNIKYIAFEYGLGGFIPRKSDLILKNRYGDCKDNTAILHALLKSRGIDSYFTWIGTKDIPYSYGDVASPAVDNHMILTYRDEKNKFHFLDATGNFHKYSTPTSFIQGKEALIGIDESNFLIERVPVLEPWLNAFNDDVTLELADNKLVGKGEAELLGYRKIKVRYNLYEAKEKEKKEYLERLLEKGSNKFVLSEFIVSDNIDADSSIKISYEFNLDSHVKIASDKLFLNLNLYDKWLGYRPEKDRKHPISLSFLNRDQQNYKFKIPQGYKLDYLPEGSTYSDGKFSYSINYELINDTIIYKHTFEINEMLIRMEMMDQFSAFYEHLEKAYKQTVLFSKEYND